MKRFILTLTAAALGGTLSACNKEEVKTETGKSVEAGKAAVGTVAGKMDEKAALAAFKAQAVALKEWALKNEPDKTNPAAAIGMIGQMIEKLKGLKTDGLPADLKTAVNNMIAATGKMADVTKDFPKDQEGFMKFMTEKATADPTFGQKFGEQMSAIGKEVETAGNALKEAGKKYGIDLDIDKK